ncbi:hypothetical protein PSP6_590048 [Paraburkholderia tropica]|nr:hypothetical protein PSP6_590048 [Paraburkholderia tropica]
MRRNWDLRIKQASDASGNRLGGRGRLTYTGFDRALRLGAISPGASACSSSVPFAHAHQACNFRVHITSRTVIHCLPGMTNHADH